MYVGNRKSSSDVTPDREFIAAIAARWSYRTPNQFHTAYHTAYGVLPSHTLRT